MNPSLAANPTYQTYMLFSPPALMQQALAAIKNIFFSLDSRLRGNDRVTGGGPGSRHCLCWMSLRCDLVQSLKAIIRHPYCWFLSHESH